MKLYAIPLGDWIELRLSPIKPRKIVSNAVVQAKKWQRNPKTNRLRIEKVDHKLESVIFEGGSIIGCLKFNDFYRATLGAIRISRGIATQIPMGLKKPLLSYLER